MTMATTTIRIEIDTLPDHLDRSRPAVVAEAIEALSKAVIQGAWAPSAASEERRLALLPRDEATAWDELMVSARYMHALSLLPI